MLGREIRVSPAEQPPGKIIDTQADETPMFNAGPSVPLVVVVVIGNHQAGNLFSLGSGCLL